MLSTRTKIAWASAAQKPIVAMRRAIGLSPELQVRRGGLTWGIDLREGVDFSIWLLGAFERRTLMAYTPLVEKGAIVFDIGANVGAHTLPLARCVGETGRVYAFEPVRWAIDKLQHNLSLNPRLMDRVSVQHRLLVDRDDAMVPAAIHASWPLGTHDDVHPKLRARPLPTDGARAITLDEFVPLMHVPQVDFIKIDVDGYECRVLRGGREILRRFRPTIIIELSPYALDEAGESLDALLDIFDDENYELCELRHHALLPRDRMALRRLIPSNGGINVLARARPNS
jgi:FkbM family methyltransferase